MAVPKNKSTAQETTARHLWLAGLGLVAVTRKEAIATAERALGGLGALQRHVARGIADAQANVVHGLEGARAQVEPTVARFSGEVESRLAPVLSRLGLEPRAKAQRKARKPAGKTTVRRTAVRKVVKATKPTARETRG